MGYEGGADENAAPCMEIACRMHGGPLQEVERAGRELAASGPLCSRGGGMNQAPTADEVMAMLREEGLVDLAADFPANGDLFAAGMDSMAVMQLIVVAEERFGAVIGPEDAG